MTATPPSGQPATPAETLDLDAIEARLNMATAPAEPAHDGPAGDDAPTDTPEGSAVLGRALLDGFEMVWLQEEPGADLWRCGTLRPQTRARIQVDNVVREVLLVSPEAGRVLEAAGAVVDKLGRIGTGGLRAELGALIDAVDAMVGDHPAPTATANLAVASHGLTMPPPIEPLPDLTDQERAAYVADAEGGDGPGWDHVGARAAVDHIRAGEATTEDADAVEALLADFAGAGRLDRRLTAALIQAERERDAARAELAEVRAQLASNTEDAARALTKARAELVEYRQLFDLQYRRMAEATALWCAEAPEGRELIQPDLGNLLTWLMDQLKLARQEPNVDLDRWTRDAAADVLDYVVERLDPSQAGAKAASLQDVRRLAADIRSGRREVPDQPEAARR